MSHYMIQHSLIKVPFTDIYIFIDAWLHTLSAILLRCHLHLVGHICWREYVRLQPWKLPTVFGLILLCPTLLTTPTGCKK